VQVFDWLEECNDKCTKVLLHYPESHKVILPIQKHVQFALMNEKLMRDEDLEQLVKDTKGKMYAAAVNYPDLQEHFIPTLEKWQG